MIPVHRNNIRVDDRSQCERLILILLVAEILHQLRLVVYPTILTVYTSQGISEPSTNINNMIYVIYDSIKQKHLDISFLLVFCVYQVCPDF